MMLALFMPLFCALVSGLCFRGIGKYFTSVITITGVFISFVTSCILFLKVHNGEAVNVVIAPFITLEGFTSNWTLFVDGLTSVMLVVVTFISMLVHIYSIGYMSEDEGYVKFMSFLSLFTFFMLLLVTAADFLQMFVGWEGVGLCSYLLIGFWNEKESANNAAIKAFITNRVGDLALILAVCVIYYIFGSLNFAFMKSNISLALTPFTVFGIETSSATIIAVLILIGCIGKSAQIFLHVWLADAMEGPTPVSALIHAATMVTAGVFLLSRVSIFFEFSESARMAVILVGTITAFFAATIAIAQDDIKKIIAYSTCSQLGYMFAASGFSAYNAAIFHLATHAFFKALLFLSAGSVIHAMSGEQDIKKMGGLAKKIPITFICMLIGSIAIAGFPPFSGFFSKDAILESAFMSQNQLGTFSFVILLLTAFITTLYSWRIIIMVFHGKTNSPKSVVDHIHESPKSMLIPLILLTIFTIFVGMFLEYGFHILSTKAGLFSESIIVLDKNNVLEKIHDTPLWVKFLPSFVSLIAVITAYFLFLSRKRINFFPNFITGLVKNKYYIDEIYQLCFINPIKKLSLFLISFFDKRIIDDTIIKMPTFISYALGGLLGRLQCGNIFVYFGLIIVSIIAIFYFVIFKSGLILF